MGLSFSILFTRFSDFFKRKINLTMVGLDGAGKTTILHQLKLSEVVMTVPTIGFNVETIQYKNISCTVWDVGGQTVIRPLWKHYFQNTQALIFVIDSCDRERIEEAAFELRGVMEDISLRDVGLLIFANKQDMPNAIKISELKDCLKLDRFMGKREWHIQACSAITKDGLYEGFEWISKLQIEPRGQ